MIAADTPLSEVSEPVHIVCHTLATIGGIETYAVSLAEAIAANGGSPRLIPTDWKVGLTSDAQRFTQRPRMPVSLIRLMRSLTHRMGVRSAVDRWLVSPCRPSSAVISMHVGLSAVTPKPPGALRVLVCHGIEVWGPRSLQMQRKLEGFDVLACVSRFTARRLSELYPTLAARTAWFPPTIRSRPSSPLEAGRAEGGSNQSFRRCDDDKIFRILTVSRLAASERYKGHDLVIESLARVAEATGKRVAYTVVGVGDDVGRLRRLAADRGVTDAVKFVGRLDGQDFEREWLAADVFAMPSVCAEKPDGTWTGEGFGIVYLEAADRGVPILATDLGGQTDFVRHMDTGVACRPSVGGVAEGLILLANDRNLGRRLADNARELLRAEFAPARFTERWANVLRTRSAASGGAARAIS